MDLARVGEGSMRAVKHRHAQLEHETPDPREPESCQFPELAPVRKRLGELSICAQVFASPFDLLAPRFSASFHSLVRLFPTQSLTDSDSPLIALAHLLSDFPLRPS
jgi:hypothetical protein